MTHVQFTVTEEGYSKLTTSETKAFPANDLVPEQFSATHTELHYRPASGQELRYLVVGSYAVTVAAINAALAEGSAKSAAPITLISGVIVVVDANITAASHVSVTPVDTVTAIALGHLVVALNPGVGFTVTSTKADNSGTETDDTSGITWFVKY